MLRGDWPPSPRQFYTANSSVPRWAYLAAGLFDPVFRRAEDVELAYRLQDLGLRFEFLPDAVIDHRPHRTFEGWQSIARQYGYYDVLMWRTKGREHILPLIGHEFRNNRPRSLQFLAKALVGRRDALNAALRLMGWTVRLSARTGLRRIAKPGLSAIFNLLYWQAVAEALGSRQSFMRTTGLRK
jgi:GT2 family glycosyltransferase